MSAMNGFEPWSPADEDQLSDGCMILLGALFGVLFVGIPICIACGWF